VPTRPVASGVGSVSERPYAAGPPVVEPVDDSSSWPRAAARTRDREPRLRAPATTRIRGRCAAPSPSSG